MRRAASATFAPAAAVFVLAAACGHDPAESKAPSAPNTHTVPRANASLPATKVGTPPADVLPVHLVGMREGELSIFRTVQGKHFIAGDTFVRALDDHGALARDEGLFMEGLPGTTQRVNEAIASVTLFDGKLPNAFYAQVTSGSFGTLGGVAVYQWREDKTPHFGRVSNRDGILEWGWLAFSSWTNDRVIGLRSWSTSDPQGGWGPMDPRWAPYDARARKALAKKGEPAFEVVSGPKAPDDLPRLPPQTTLVRFSGASDGRAFGIVSRPPTGPNGVTRSELVRWVAGDPEPKPMDVPEREHEHVTLDMLVRGPDELIVWSNDSISTASVKPFVLQRWRGGAWSKIETPMSTGKVLGVAVTGSGERERLFAILDESPAPQTVQGHVYVRASGTWTRAPLPSVTFPNQSGPVAKIDPTFMMVTVEEPDPKERLGTVPMFPQQLITVGDAVLVIGRAEGFGIVPSALFSTVAPAGAPTLFPSNEVLELVKAERKGWKAVSLDRLGDCKGTDEPAVVAIGETATLGDVAKLADAIREEDAATPPVKRAGDERPFRYFEAPVAGKPSLVAMVDGPGYGRRTPSRARMQAFFSIVKKLAPKAAPSIYCRWITPTRDLAR